MVNYKYFQTNIRKWNIIENMHIEHLSNKSVLGELILKVNPFDLFFF